MADGGHYADSGCAQLTQRQLDKDVNMEAIQARMMQEIQAKLSAKEEEFWRRGQVEIKRLQQQQQEVTTHLAKMQEQQSEMALENKQLRGALVEVTSKFEKVLKQMTEVIRSLPKHSSQGKQPPSSPSFAPEARRQEDEGGHLEGAPSDTSGSLAMWHGARGARETEAGNSDLKATLCTPRRMTTQDFACSSSPAVLSIASALPSTHPKLQLQLAECIDQASPGKSTVTPSPPPRSKRMSMSSQATAESSDHCIVVQLTKGPGFTTLGIEVNQDEDTLRVERVDEYGLVGKFNSSQEGEGKILVGDSIVKVNGVGQDPDSMLQVIKEAEQLTLTIRTQANSPTRLRPEAQEFVPSEKEFHPPGERPALALLQDTSDSEFSKTEKVNRKLFR
ncbi:unnamed protein product [Effrenium voratum]|nr:unnamed protein product [Effrenium voratum]